MMKNKNDQVDSKKSLINSLDVLNSKAYAIGKLREFSYNLLGKFTNPQAKFGTNEKASISELPEKGLSKDEHTPDLIDLFDKVSDMMDEDIRLIREHLEQIYDIVGEY